MRNLTPGIYLVVDPITDATETAASCTVSLLDGGENIEITDPDQIRALYDHPTARPFGEGNYTVDVKITYVVRVASNSDSDVQPEVAALELPDVYSVVGIDTDRVRVTMRLEADFAAFNAALDADPGVLGYEII